MMSNTKLLPLIILTALAITSCSKKDKPADPTPQQPGRDASYLLKTSRQYTRDDKGTIFNDTILIERKWDENNRLTVEIESQTNGVYTDTLTNTYSNGKRVQQTVYYSQGTKSNSSLTTFYINSKGLTDSCISTTIYYTVPGQSSYVTYYFYDANGNDTAEATYGTANGTKVYNNTRRRTYTGNVLATDQIVHYSGFRYFYAAYVNGDEVVDSSWYYPSKALSAANAYTYTDILSGGFYAYYPNATHLLATSRQKWVLPPTDETSTFSYTFDSKHRVSTEKEALTSAARQNITEYTYY